MSFGNFETYSDSMEFIERMGTSRLRCVKRASFLQLQSYLVTVFAAKMCHLNVLINSAGKRDRLRLLVSSDKLLVTNRPKAAAEGSGLRSLSYPRNGRGPLPKAAARAPLGFAVFQKVEVRVAQFHS